MKLIELYIENFGKLTGYKYSFSSGLNVINEENGYGKSTLAVFIKSMLFGLEDTRKSKLDENDRKKYLPWQGGSCGGTLTVSVGGKRYRIERTFAPKAADDTFTLYDCESGKESKDFGPDIGEELFGINVDGFERTVFLSERRLSVKNDNKTISAKLSDLVGCDGDVGELDEAVAFAKSLYEEYGRFFSSLGCDTFDIGGDELLGFGESIDDSVSKWNNLDHWRDHARRITGDENAVAYDAFVLYMNEIADLVRSLGYKRVRMWNDDVYRFFDTGWSEVAKIDKNIEIQYWSTAANGGINTPNYYIDRGHGIYNFVGYYSYYVPGLRHKYGITPDKITAEWNPYVFDREHPENDPSFGDGRVKGFGACLWCDIPTAHTEDEILADLIPYFAAYAKKCEKRTEPLGERI